MVTSIFTPAPSAPPLPTPPSFTATDHALMTRALRLAERGAYTTRPNPMVGCVLAHGDDVVGEGFHQRAGEAHAEVSALRAAGDRARGATAYVTLEPCGRHGRTPPCADALIAAGVARVVVATADSNQHGEGAVERLRGAGIVVEHGLLETAARELNRGFFARIERGRPWLRIKLAMSLDGRSALASGESRWISSAASRADVQRWRARSGALLTASGTVLADDPRLTVRPEEGGFDAAGLVPPLRVVLDTGLAIPERSQVLDASAPTLLLHAPDARVAGYLQARDHAPIATEGNQLDLTAVMQLLAARGINEVQTEVGATVCGALLRAGLVDELLLYVAPLLLGARGRPLFAGWDVATMAERLDLNLVESRMLGPDIRLLLRPKRRVD